MTTRSDWHLREMAEGELDALYEKRIEKDFVRAERPSLQAMHRHVREGLQDILIMTDGERDAAYAVCTRGNGIVLVTLLAVYEEMRGGGNGTALMSLLAQRFADSRAIVLEVEAPEDAAQEADRIIRERRIAFYERNGYRLLEGIRHDSFGVHLLIMVKPLMDTAGGVQATAIEDLGVIYHRILPMHLWPRVTTAATE